MVAYTVLFCHTTKSKKAKAIFVWCSKERADLKMKHDANNVLTDDELVIVRGLLKKSEHACLYIQNEYLRGFKVLNLVYEVIVFK